MKKAYKTIKKYIDIIRGIRKPSRELIHNVQGSVSIFLLVIMLPMLVFSFSVLDVCKIFLAQDSLADATNIALRSAATGYDDILKDMYGIIATSKSNEELINEVSKYFSATLSSHGLKSSEDGAAEDFIKSLFNSDISEEIGNNDNFLKVYPAANGTNALNLQTVESSAVTNPTVLKRQIIEYMKYRGPVEMTAGFLEKINVLKDLPNQTKVVDDKIDFEIAASSASDSAIITYSLLAVYKYNNDILYGDNTVLKLANENEKANFVNIYKYPYTDKFSLASLKTLSADEGLGQGLEHLKRSATYLAAIGQYLGITGFPNVERKNLSAGSTSDSEKVSKVEDSYNSITSYYAYKELYDEIKTDGQVHSDIETLKDACKGFSTSNHTVSSVNKAEDAFDLLNEMAPLFKGGRDPYGFSSKCAEFLSCYKYMKDHDSSEAFKEALENEDYQKLYNQLDSALDEIKTQVNNIYNAAKGQFETGQNILNKCYDAMYRQYHIICALLGEEETYGTIGGNKKVGLKATYDEFMEAKKKSEEYKTSIDGVTNETQKNSYLADYNSEALDFSKLNEGDVTKMTAELTKQKAVYKAAMDDIARIIYLNNNNTFNVIDQSAVDISKSGQNNDFKKAFSLTVINNFIKDRLAEDSFSTIISGVYSDNWVTRYAPFGAQANDYSNWKELFNKLTDTESNPFYVEVKKYATPAREATEEGKELKDKVGDAAKVGDNGVPEAAKTDGSSNSSEGSSSASDKNKFGWDVKLSDYKTFAQSYTDSGTAPKGDGTSIKAEIGGDDTAKANAAKSLMSQISSMLQNLGEAIGESALVSEYFVTQFSCHTTSMDGKGNRKNDESMLTGYPFYDAKSDKANVVWYGAEQEYILYGLDTPEANIAAAGAVIYGIRFVLNLIYSFTDAEIRSFTLSVATAAGGVFPPAIPLIQTALHIGLAMAESAYDLMKLMDGAEVPIFKTSDTWVCKGTNIVREVAAEALDKVVENVVNPLIDKAADELCGLINKASEGAGNAISSTNGNVKQLVDEEAKKIKGEIEINIVTPLESAIQSVIVNYNANMNIKEELMTKLNLAVKNMENTLGLGGAIADDDLFRQAEKKVLDVVKSNVNAYADTVAANINDYINAAAGISVSEISDETNKALGTFSAKIRTLFDKVYTEIDKVTVSSKEFTDKLAAMLTEKLNQLSEKAQNGVKVLASDVKDAVTGLSDDIRGKGHINIDINSGGATGETSKKSLIGMNYQDYLHIFMMISVITGDTNQLERAGQLIYANVKKTSGKSDFDLNKTYTVIGAEGTASVRTVFLGTLFENGNIKTPTTSNIYKLTYTEYWGY